MPRMSFAHKREHAFEQRIAESARVRERYNDRVPVICEKMPSSDVPNVDKCAPAPLRAHVSPLDSHRRLALSWQVEVPHPDGHDCRTACLRLAQADLPSCRKGDLRVREQHVRPAHGIAPHPSARTRTRSQPASHPAYRLGGVAKVPRVAFGPLTGQPNRPLRPGRLPPSGALMSNIYLKHKDEDGFLYICYSGENTFGSDGSTSAA